MLVEVIVAVVTSMGTFLTYFPAAYVINLP